MVQVTPEKLGETAQSTQCLLHKHEPTYKASLEPALLTPVLEKEAKGSGLASLV